MSSSTKKAKKNEMIKKLYDRLSKHSQIIVVNLMNVGSNQVQCIRNEVRKRRGELLIGKNTVIRKAISLRANELDKNHPEHEYFKNFGAPNPKLNELSKQMRKKVGLIFTDTPVFELKPVIESNRVQTAAKVGAISPCDVTVPAGPTGCDPSQISFFHALNISTKIQKGQIEIVKDVKVCTKGQQVGNSEATLLQKLNIRPFMYGMEIVAVYDDGSILAPEVVALSPNDILEKFKRAATNISALSLSLGLVNDASVPHILANAFKNLAAISLVTDYKLAALANVGKAAAPSGGSGGAAPAKTEAAKVETKAKDPEPEPEEDFDMGGLFG